MDFAYKIYMKRYDCCPQPFYDITYFLVLKRSPSYYIFSLVIPSAFITVVTIVGFFTPHSTTGENTEKVSLGVTALLSMAIIMMMVSDEVPATSEVIPLIGMRIKFQRNSNCFSFLLKSLLLARGNAGRQLNPRIKRLLFEKIACNRYFSWAFSVQLPKRKRVLIFNLLHACSLCVYFSINKNAKFTYLILFHRLM
uniref:Neurotransmitter-gated ion-channel transmembrane domain-containing protein n=1 Tax=Parascaris equorum TaxID=6256 RepID=A0A914RLE9_PAREQ